MGDTFQPDIIVVDFNPHVLTALICLIVAVMIVLIRVMIDQADQKRQRDRQ
jgi:hypothetical protein